MEYDVSWKINETICRSGLINYSQYISILHTGLVPHSLGIFNLSVGYVGLYPIYVYVKTSEPIHVNFVLGPISITKDDTSETTVQNYSALFYSSFSAVYYSLIRPYFIHRFLQFIVFKFLCQLI